MHSSSGAKARVGKRRAELGVRRDAAHDGDPLETGRLGRRAQPLHERTHDRALVRRREVCPPGARVSTGSEIAYGVEKRGLEPGEREVETGHAGDREVERRRIAFPSDSIDRSASRVAETEQPRTLVERLARGVVEGRPEPLGPALLR